jgi:hypothetical protein
MDMGRWYFTWLLLPLLLAGCLASPVRSSLAPGQLDVYDVTLGSLTDYREIRGVRGTDEPCLRGYERSFAELDIVLSYDRDGKIRKITTRNPQNSMFGVHPGDSAASAMAKLRGAGFVENAPSRFRKEGLLFSILVDGTGRLFGISLETTDPAN